MRAKYVLNEVLVGLWRNVTMTVAMIITMSVSLIMLGASVLMYMQVDRMKTYYYGEIEVAIFLNENATDAQRSGLDAALSSNPLVAQKTYESKDQAYQKFQQMWKDSPSFVSAIKPGDLPDSYRVKLKNPEQFAQFHDSIANLPGISDVVDQRQLLGKVFNIFNSLRGASLVFAGFMGVAALLLVGNTIQVAAYSKRREVAVMKLVGASNWFIQAPFVLEAVAAGLIGSVVGWVFLFVAKKLVVDGSLQDLTRVLTPVPDTNVLLQLPIMAGAGAVVSALTAWITLRFYLKV